MRYNPPPNWPPTPSGWKPPLGWQPDPAWPPPPPGWRLWLPDGPQPAAPQIGHAYEMVAVGPQSHRLRNGALGLVAVVVAVVVGVVIIVSTNTNSVSGKPVVASLAKRTGQPGGGAASGAAAAGTGPTGTASSAPPSKTVLSRITPIRATFTGHGNDVIKLKTVLKTAAFLRITMGGSAENSLLSLGTDGKSTGLLVSTVGRYQGQTLANVYAGDLTAGFQVESGGDWTIDMDGLATVPIWDATKAYAGRGDTVLNVDGDFTPAQRLGFTAHDVGSTTLTAYGSEAHRLVDKVGSTAGHFVLPKGTTVLQVRVGEGGTFTLTRR